MRRSGRRVDCPLGLEILNLRRFGHFRRFRALLGGRPGFGGTNSGRDGCRCRRDCSGRVRRCRRPGRWSSHHAGFGTRPRRRPWHEMGRRWVTNPRWPGWCPRSAGFPGRVDWRDPGVRRAPAGAPRCHLRERFRRHVRCRAGGFPCRLGRVGRPGWLRRACLGGGVRRRVRGPWRCCRLVRRP